MIYDITRELFSTEVYPGDPVPGRKFVMSYDKEEPDVCQVTELTLGSHSGTHMDAPRHFCRDGKTIAQVDLDKCMGTCVVVCPDSIKIHEKECKGASVGKAAPAVLTRAELELLLIGQPERVLLKGGQAIDEEAAEYLVARGVVCVGTEALSIAPLSRPVKVHRILLEAEIIILEGLDLTEIVPGEYELTALPLKMEALDGSPVRAVLRSLDGGLDKC